MPLKPRNSKFEMNTWLRTCQECFHVQKDNPPSQPPTNAYCNRKCRKCGNEALDHGGWNYYYEAKET